MIVVVDHTQSTCRFLTLCITYPNYLVRLIDGSLSPVILLLPRPPTYQQYGWRTTIPIPKVGMDSIRRMVASVEQTGRLRIVALPIACCSLLFYFSPCCLSSPANPANSGRNGVLVGLGLLAVFGTTYAVSEANTTVYRRADNSVQYPAHDLRTIAAEEAAHERR
jgi:hypothetical protein